MKLYYITEIGFDSEYKRPRYLTTEKCTEMWTTDLEEAIIFKKKNEAEKMITSLFQEVRSFEVFGYIDKYKNNIYKE